MSRKDFNAIAEAFRQLNEETMNHGAISLCAKRIANVCADSNPRFDRARFLAACGVLVSEASQGGSK
jgi:hypothetical protein